MKDNNILIKINYKHFNLVLFNFKQIYKYNNIHKYINKIKNIIMNYVWSKQINIILFIYQQNNIII